MANFYEYFSTHISHVTSKKRFCRGINFRERPKNWQIGKATTRESVYQILKHRFSPSKTQHCSNDRGTSPCCDSAVEKVGGHKKLEGNVGLNWELRDFCVAVRVPNFVAEVGANLLQYVRPEGK